MIPRTTLDQDFLEIARPTPNTSIPKTSKVIAAGSGIAVTLDPTGAFKNIPN